MNVIITGNSKGIGLALTIEFLKAGDDVIVSSRSEERVKKTVKSLKEQFPGRAIFGFPCDVADEQKVVELAQFGKDTFSTLNFWINNAGISDYLRQPFLETPTIKLKEVININLVGTMNGCKAALSVMLPQKFGHILNMQGRGWNLNPSPRMVAYGASKAAVRQFTKTLAEETKDTGVGVHELRPGMVFTDLLLKDIPPQDEERVKRFAQPPETVAKYLVPKIRSVKGTGKEISFQID